MQGLELVVALAQLVHPVGVLEHLVKQQGLAAFLHKLRSKLQQRMQREIEVVEVDIQRLTRSFMRQTARFLAGIC